MVVGALVSYFSPSNRGFVRIKDSDNVPLDSYPIYDDPLNSLDRNNPQQRAQQMTARRRKPLRAMAVLTSIASDFDLISDWFFLRHSFHENRQYREQYRENPEEGELPYLIPKSLLIGLLISCILGSITYVVIATEGRAVAPIMTRLGVDKISMGLVLFISVLVEDIPQIILTFLIEDYYEEGGFLSEVAVFNLMASLYDTCIKLAESFDQRHDVVETGVWCKKSINAHEAIVTDVLILPNEIELQNSDFPPDRRRSTSDALLVRTPAKRKLLTADRRCTSETVMKAATQQRSMKANEMSISASSLPTRRASQTQLLVDAFFPEEESIPPQTHFLTTSMDRTGKLWNVEAMADASVSSSSHKKECIRVFKDAESEGFTCLAWVGPRNANEKSRVNYFLTGCNNGNTKLWDLSGLCHRSYQWEDNSNNRVASITAAHINGKHTFICGHESGVIRLWQTWVGNCLGQIQGHTKRVAAITLVDDGTRFVSASVDGTLKLWESSLDFQKRKQEQPGIEVQVAAHEGNSAAPYALNHSAPSKCLVLHGDEEAAVKRFVGHRGAVLSVVAVDDRVILSGSQDATARLWSIESGLCLRVFSGHHGGVYSVLAIDRVTFLTGSSDTTIKAWDALSGTCLRTYEGHKRAVTGLSLGPASDDATEGATTFISSSADKSVKCWVLTAVSYRDPAAALDHILDIHENTCRCFDAATYGCGQQQPGSLLRACSPDQCEFDHPYYYEGFQT